MMWIFMIDCITHNKNDHHIFKGKYIMWKKKSPLRKDCWNNPSVS